MQPKTAGLELIQFMPRHFSRFATKSDKWTGLGLLISRSIIEAHEGRIWCSNNSNSKGATFVFSLPAL
ncbi:MAG TPA: ATP-binding protein [Nitrososphaera sp.]|nr:ATP-binding protein [Nitrososphaera sp.]